MNITAKIERALWLNQSFFNEENSGLDYHEICLYYLIDISETDLLAKNDSFSLTDEQGTTHHYEWLTFDKLKDVYFYPLFLKEKIFDLPNNLELMVESRF